MKKQSKHFPWGDNVHAAREQATAFYEKMIADPKNGNVEKWQDPAFKRTTVEWVGAAA